MLFVETNAVDRSTTVHTLLFFKIIFDELSPSIELQLDNYVYIKFKYDKDNICLLDNTIG